MIDAKPEGSVDATGLETRYASRYYAWRRGQRGHERLRWPKLTVVCHSATHLLAGADVSWGPSQDSPQFPPVMHQAAELIRFDRLLADAAYDAEHNHELCRDRLNIRSTVIPINPRRSRKWPHSRYRRQMKRRFHRQIYGHRWQIESAFSRNKRRLGPALRARKWEAQQQEVLLRVLTHNLMILLFAP